MHEFDTIFTFIVPPSNEDNTNNGSDHRTNGVVLVMQCNQGVATI